MRDSDPVVPAFGAERCALYLRGTEGNPPREQLVEALGRFALDADAPRALDMGCGPGREVGYLLAKGFRVVAVDPSREMLVRTRAVASAIDGGVEALELVHATLEEFAARVASESFDLVHAGFVLPFVLPERFDGAWRALRAGVAPGGLFVGQFFGPDDEFVRTAEPGTMTSQSFDEVRALFVGFDLLAHEEVNREGKVGSGRAKWWHVHHVVARRQPTSPSPSASP